MISSLPTIRELTGIKLVINAALPANSLLLVGRANGMSSGQPGMIGIIDLTGALDRDGKGRSWISEAHTLLEIHGTKEALSYFTERLSDGI